MPIKYFLQFLICLILLLTNTVFSAKQIKKNNVDIENSSKLLTNKLKQELSTIQFVYNAAKYAIEHGKKKALKEFNKKNSIFINNNNYLYAYIYKGIEKGTLVAHTTDSFCSGKNLKCQNNAKKLIGRNLLDRYFSGTGHLVQTNIEVAKKGGGWIPAYCWKNPATNKIQLKKAFVLPIPGQDFFIGSGYYLPNECKPN